MPDKKNPYAAAADAYGSMAGSVDQRAMEGKILLRAASRLEDTSRRLAAGEKIKSADIADVLEYNQKLWQLFVEDARNPDHPLPSDIKNNIATLALFIFKRTLELRIDPKPEKFQAVIEINRNIAAGLMKQVKPLPGQQQHPTDSKPKADSIA
ncbi:MAG: flagellar biosynthesis regulator FlaF [Micavibrio sp.]|nr:flagellar biosynthesis regulator FlaF [Micavibrio sp.]